MVSVFRPASGGPTQLLASILVSLALIGLPAVAQVAQQDPAQRLLQEQRDQDRQRELAQPAPQIAVPSLPAASADSDAVDVESVPEQGQVFAIDRIELIGNTLLPEAEVAAVVAPFSGRRLGSQRINLLIRRLTKAFDSHGWSTTRAYLGKQNLSGGTLVVTVVPGVVQSIRLNDHTLSPRAGNLFFGENIGGGLLTDEGARMALPTAPGEVLNISDLEQGVEQINRLRRNKAELQILPGTSPGSSVISLTNKAGDRLWYSAGVDNYGSSQTGLNRTRFGIEADNVLGFQEALSLNFIGSRETNALVASAAVPFGYNTFSYTASLSEYQSLIGDTALLYGSTIASTFGWNRVLTRSQSSKSAFDASLSIRHATRDINDLTLDPQNLSVLRLGLNTLRRLTVRKRPASWTFDAGISEGLDAFGASQDDSSLLQSDAHSQFTKFDFTGTASLPLVAIADSSLNWASQISGQWSNRGLFGSEQIYVGGMSTVRGFREAGVSGDRGVYTRNEIVWSNVPRVLGIHFEPYVFFDIGVTELLDEQASRRLSGIGLGTRLDAQIGRQSLSGEVTLGRPVQQPDFLEPKSVLLLATLNWSY
jgi:hemolysin activation/secretion protein